MFFTAASSSNYAVRNQPYEYYIFTLFQCNLEYDGFATIKLQHALEGGPNPQFTDRGNITITSLRLGQAHVNDKPLTDAERTKLKRLAAENGFYHLKSIVTTNDGSESVYVSTVKAVSACVMFEHVFLQ